MNRSDLLGTPETSLRGLSTLKVLSVDKSGPLSPSSEAVGKKKHVGSITYIFHLFFEKFRVEGVGVCRSRMVLGHK